MSVDTPSPESRHPSASSQFTKDLEAGFLVSLIALPLSLGIAVASGFPASSGIIAAIVGGIVTSLIGGARLTIKGPAAGLIVIVLGAVTELADPSNPLSGIERAAAVVVAAGIIQVLLGLFRCGVFAELMPGSVIHGMLAAIGIIVMGKQIHVVLGVTPTGKTPIELWAEVGHSLTHLNPAIALIGITSLAVMILCARYPLGILRKIPAVLIVMIVAIGFDIIFDLNRIHPYFLHGAEFPLGPQFLVKLPPSLTDAVFMPDWSHLFTPTSIKYIAFFAIVGSIESLLTVSAVNGMDPERRRANPDRDLIALGMGNIVSGMLGGLPMISEIVRSKANVDAQARSSVANITHGVLLLAYLGILSPILSLVPLSALAGVLVYIGFRLAAPKEFVHAWSTGKEQFFFFFITCFLTVTEDLLVGVAAGLVCAIIYVIFRGTKPAHLLSLSSEVEKKGDKLLVRLHSNAIFSNFVAFRKLVESAGSDVKEVLVDFSECCLVEHTFRDKLERLQAELGRVTISVTGLSGHHSLGTDPHATKILRSAGQK